VKINQEYLDALRDWVGKGPASGPFYPPLDLDKG
jgi:hypothetical protein